MSNLFIPKKLKVGFQSRTGTYTGKLAYITYYDEKNVLRKEKSWEDWRDEDINPVDCENEPTEGFVLNKNLGGKNNGWDSRQAYIRVYDPREFEFEITLENLMYILNTEEITKGKLLSGKYVYSISGTQLILLPVSSLDYEEIENNSKIKNSRTVIKKEDLVIGNTYLDKRLNKFIYFGKYQSRQYDHNPLKSNYVFLNKNHYGKMSYVFFNSLNDRFIGELEDEKVCIDEYLEEINHLIQFNEVEVDNVKIPLTKEIYELYYNEPFNSQFYPSIRDKSTGGRVSFYKFSQPEILKETFIEKYVDKDYYLIGKKLKNGNYYLEKNEYIKFI